MKTSSFHIIPAIDLFDKQVVRLYQGKYNKVTVYKESPAEKAREFQEAGAAFLHLVDLNAARSGQRNENTKAIKEIVKTAGTKMSVELGGGIRDMTSLKEAFDLGIDRCIIGTAAVKNIGFLDDALASYGTEKIIVGVDISQGMVRISGWEQESSLQAKDFLLQLEKRGVSQVIFTDISRDGTLSGPGEALREYIDLFKLDFILSGGLSSLEDLKQILTKRHPRLVAVISGRALYEKKLDLRLAVQMCKNYKNDAQ